MDLYFLNIKDISDNDILDIKNHLPLRYLKSSSFKNEEDRLRCLGAGVLLRRCFPTLKEEDIFYNQYGKPYIKSKFFNISHSGNYVLLIIADNETGIDIQKIKSININNFNSILSDNEKNTLNKNSDFTFYKIWTRKESVIKLLGVGLKIPLKTIDTTLYDKDGFIKINNKIIYISTFEIEDYIYSVSSLNKEKIIKHF